MVQHPSTSGNTIVDRRNAFVRAFTTYRRGKRKWVRIQPAMASREGIPPGSSTWLTQTVLHFRSPLGEAAIGARTKARHRGESFRNRIATQRGSWKRGKRPVESERESRLRKRNCSAARRTLARNFPPGYHLPYPRWNREIQNDQFCSFPSKIHAFPNHFQSQIGDLRIFNQIQNEEIFVWNLWAIYSWILNRWSSLENELIGERDRVEIFIGFSFYSTKPFPFLFI